MLGGGVDVRLWRGLGTDEGFGPRPDLRAAHAGEWGDRVADLHYADTPEYATGHGASAEWELVDGGAARSARRGSGRRK